MDEKPHQLLDRDAAVATIAEHFSPYLALLRDVTNYGSNLYLRAYNSSPQGLPDVILCGVLLRQMVVMIDAVYESLKSGSVNTAYLPARAALEASLYLDWMLFSDTEHKVKCYYVSNLRHERMWGLRAIAGTSEEQSFDAVLNTLGLDLHAGHPNLGEDAKKHVAEVDAVLAQPELAAVNAEFDAARGKKPWDPDWFKVCGAKSLRSIADTLKRLPEYEVLYSKGSRVVHAASFKDHIDFRKGHVHFKALRQPDGIDQILNIVIAMAVRSYRHVIQTYRPGEMGALNAKYVDDWRKTFMAIPKVVIKPE